MSEWVKCLWLCIASMQKSNKRRAGLPGMQPPRALYSWSISLSVDPLMHNATWYSSRQGHLLSFAILSQMR